MTHLKPKSDFVQLIKKGLRNEPYVIINLIFAGVIVLVIAYSGIFSPEKNNYPVACIHEKITGEPCISCGLSHSFSLIVRGQFSKANEWNISGLRVFIFFVAQLILRVVFTMFFLKYSSTRKQLIITDSAGSALLFLIAFWPYIVKILTDIF